MADHISLPRHHLLPTKRVSFNFDPDPPPFNFSGHATTLRGVLEGLEQSSPGIFAEPEDLQDGEVLNAAELGEIVFKFTGDIAFDSNAFAGINMRPLAVDDSHHYYALTSAQARSAFKSLAADFVGSQENFAAETDALAKALKNVEGVELYSRQDRIQDESIILGDGVEGVVDVDISLWPTSIAVQGAEKEGRRRVEVVADLIRSRSSDDARVQVLAASSNNPDLLLIHARLDKLAFDLVAEHPYVERLRGPLKVSVSQAQLAAGGVPRDTILPEGVPIGIIDDLVSSSNPWLEGVVVEARSFPSPDIFGDSTSHGTQVAGIAAWGDVRELLDPNFDGQPFPLYAARIAQANSNLEAQVIGQPAEQLRQALDWLASCDVRIVVLALGESFPDDGAITSELSAIVDEKILEHGLVVVTSAGNVRDIEGDWAGDYPSYLKHAESRISAPGTAASALTVTSIAHSAVVDRSRWPHGIAIAGKGEVSPFSRTGPIRGSSLEGRQKPEFAGHGGSWAIDSATNNLITDDAELAITTLIPTVNGRHFGSASGTSLAAPRVAHEVAKIQTRYRNASGNLLRALTALAGSESRQAVAKKDEILAGFYGVPDATRVLESGGNSVIFTYEGEIPTNRHAVVTLPIPREFAAGSSSREIRIALAFDPPVRRSRRHYVAGQMHFNFHQGITPSEIMEAYAAQPKKAERELQGIDAVKLPRAREMNPPRTHLSGETLICRSFAAKQSGWNEDDEHYNVVVSHDHSPWTRPQKDKYLSQKFALAIQLIDHDRLDIDLYAQAILELQAQVRGRSSFNDHTAH